MKTAGIRIRIEPELRDAFADECKRNGANAATVLRDFMQHYIDAGEASRQGKLFPSEVTEFGGIVQLLTYEQ